MAKVAAVDRTLAHIKYIQHRPGEDRGDGGRELFSDIEDNLDGKKVRKAVREQEDSKVVAHKLTLAPEINPEDKKAFTREIMHRIGSEKGLDLQWVGTAHNNTDHHHIHVVVLGKDKNGKDVRFDKDDYNKIKEYGDRYLERHHPYELEKSRQERERKERERIETRQKERESARQERIREGLELPWLHKKIVREQLEPYEKWKVQQEEKEKAASDKSKQPGKEPEKPYFQDTIGAAGKEWSRENTLQELRGLNEYLWDHQDERIDIKEYKKLVRWMKDKERLQEKEKQAPAKETPAKDDANQAPTTVQEKEKNKDSFDWKGEKYSKNDSYERLSGLAKELRGDKKERLPVEDYQRLRGWIEHRDRERFSGVLEKQLTQAKTQFDQEQKTNNSPAAGRWVDPLQQQVMSNPVIGVFMTGANIANTVVSWIDLRDNRDRLKEAGDELQAAKLDKHQDYLKHGKPEDRDRDEATIDKLDKAIDDNKEARRNRDEEKKRKQKEKEKEHDPFRYDPWGQY
jgi:hypothetical protein